MVMITNSVAAFLFSLLSLVFFDIALRISFGFAQYACPVCDLM